MKKLKGRNIGSSASATKGDIEQLRGDIHADMHEYFTSKEEFRKEQRRQNQKHKELLEAFKVHTENLISAMQGAHNDELAAVEGKKDVPLTWKSVPRRLNAIEEEVGKIKDHLEIL